MSIYDSVARAREQQVPPLASLRSDFGRNDKGLGMVGAVRR